VGRVGGSLCELGEGRLLSLRPKLSERLATRALLDSVPTQPFYANELPPKIAAAAREVCVAAGVQAAPLLNACTVDAAVLRNKATANVYRTLPTPAVWGLLSNRARVADN
jgi:hypothetical protein